MSKTTKIIAALGVVAGLGVAALPAFTYATSSVQGQVEVEVDVASAIAMTIRGNNDYDGTTDPRPAGVKDGVSVYNGSSEIGSYDATSTNPQGVDNTASGYALQTSGSKTNILPNALVEGVITGADANGFGSTITVYTNDSGYSLTVQDANNDNSLTSGSNTIPAVGTTTPTNTLTPGSAAWGFKGGLITSWTAVPVNDGGTTQPATIKNGSGATLMTGDETEVLYAVSTAAAQPVGTYTDTIVYTATTAN